LPLLPVSTIECRDIDECDELEDDACPQSTDYCMNTKG
jgi:hypothetical protein